MLVSPVIERELRTALRKHNPVKSRLIAAAIAGGFSLLFLLFGLIAPGWGQELHFYLFIGSLYFAVIRPTQIAVGIISEERRNQTLELLFLTGMTSMELFIGKVLGATLVASCELLAIVPFLALPFLSGGLSIQLYLATIACLPLLLLFVISVSILASTLCRDDTMAVVTTWAIVLAISCATPIPFYLGHLLSSHAPFAADWLSLSPGYGAIMVGTRFRLGSPAAFWQSAACTVSWTILCFCLAAYTLSRNWREDPDAQLIRNWRAKWQSLVRGTLVWRANLRAVVLTKNPYQWLAQQDRRPVLIAWGIILFLCFLWLVGWALWPRQWPSTGNFFITAMVMNLAIENIITHTAARRIGHDRRDNTLELLLTTPLSPIEIVHGQVTAIREQFEPVRRGVLALCGMMMIGGFFTRTWNILAIISYIMIWCIFFFWCRSQRTNKVPFIMWLAVNTGRPTFAAFRAGGGISSWFWIIFQLRNVGSFGGAYSAFPKGTVGETWIVGFIAVVIVILMVAFDNYQPDATLEFSRHLRSIAPEPVPEPHDPRYKEWKDLKQRFPSHEPKPRLADLLIPKG